MSVVDRGEPVASCSEWHADGTTGEQDPAPTWRRGELAGLRWADVDLEGGRLSVRQPRVVVANLPQPSEPKTARGRRVTGARRGDSGGAASASGVPA